ncbi:MAG: protein jag [Oscillospiraceae bacterium]|nr:protein jag [Oscillospiraceae bacterium]
MTKYIEAVGKNEEEAVRKGLEELGLDRDDVTVEILERAKSGFLGIGAVEAKVRLTYEFEESKAEMTERFLKGLFEHMGVEADTEITEDANTINVTIVGENPGALIGRRGETLDAIQHLANYSVNRGGGRVRISIDAENYRERRNETLEKLARKTAEKVLKYRRNITLEAMNSYERHVIHTALQDYEGITTFSTGTEPNRRVVVAYDRTSAPAPKPTYREWK